MKQNKYFKLSRFIHLLKYDFLLNGKTYLFALVGIFIAIYAFTFLLMSNRGGGFHRYESYIPLMLFYLLACGVFVGTGFPALKNTIKRSSFLILPASTFEKFLAQFFIRVLIFVPVALGIFWIGTHFARTSAMASLEFRHLPATIVEFNFGDLFANMVTRDCWMIVIGIFSLTCLLYAGSAFFNRYALVKTLVFFGLTIGAYLLVAVVFSHIFFPERLIQFFDIHLESYRIKDDLYNVQLLAYIVASASWLFFLPLAYFKLKEKEV